MVPSPLGFAVRTTKAYWLLITHVKHPSIAGRERAVQNTLAAPDQVRQSKIDHTVYLFYRQYGRKHLCVVAKRLGPSAGFIMTAYYTEKVKEGQVVWKK